MHGADGSTHANHGAWVTACKRTAGKLSARGDRGWRAVRFGSPDGPLLQDAKAKYEAVRAEQEALKAGAPLRERTAELERLLGTDAA